MGNTLVLDDLIGVIMQGVTFLLGIALVIFMEFVELKKRQLRAKRLTDFTITSRLSQSKS